MRHVAISFMLMEEYHERSILLIAKYREFHCSVPSNFMVHALDSMSCTEWRRVSCFQALRKARLVWALLLLRIFYKLFHKNNFCWFQLIENLKLHHKASLNFLPLCIFTQIIAQQTALFHVELIQSRYTNVQMQTNKTHTQEKFRCILLFSN